MLETIMCPTLPVARAGKSFLFHERSDTGAHEARFGMGYKDTARGHFVRRCDTRLGKQRRLQLLPSLQRLR